MADGWAGALPCQCLMYPRRHLGDVNSFHQTLTDCGRFIVLSTRFVRCGASSLRNARLTASKPHLSRLTVRSVDFIIPQATPQLPGSQEPPRAIEGHPQRQSTLEPTGCGIQGTLSNLPCHGKSTRLRHKQKGPDP